MAAVAICSNLPGLTLARQLRNSRSLVLRRPNKLFLRRAFTAKVRALSTAVVETKQPEPAVEETNVSTSRNILACPICYEQLSIDSDGGLTVDSISGSSLLCNTCKKTYYGSETHFELTASSGAKEYGEAKAPSTEFFRIPLISYIYERGWRQGFLFGGFPGPEKEFELIKNYLKPVLGGNIIDASCGSGLFARLFAKSGLFSLVVALDYSENMLKECYEFIKQEDNFPKEKLTLVRADISRLPFPSSSIDAIHAGAAIHCWPSPSAAVAEISRVLRPGGVFVGTTYILDGPFSFVPLLSPVTQNLTQISGSHMFTSEGQLKDLFRACGLVNFQCTRQRRFIMFSATKPC
ncbi:uncharacterized methyltransferase At1g78140, chloroplastic [Punica granatum]|uniref:Methyltransferase type 11 domain-containing protein n=2 Tax=Punica granatum TaxID=22663 RepID=A0A218X6E9_PUNGR|nr:uncharacterized methyltransferase At1g78140, chloroplastic [Punica granatum]XP_031391608.1 uncharacterized methyltransferase At1g78140, chloroplastic [Punica granatum]OWM79942.1 hypothetical protein CDL15_Pgr006246 [Punica granatum]PKI73896.1 hypothetical protein CRG98_005766 [Punica granatum]